MGFFDKLKKGLTKTKKAFVSGIDTIFGAYEEVGEDLSVYITGGNAALVLPYCKQKMIFDEHLVLKGLNIIYKRNS